MSRDALCPAPSQSLPAMNKKQIQLKKKEKERKDSAGSKTATSKESLVKQAKDAAAHKCVVCLTTFMITAKSKHLAEHCDSKHAKLPRERCFPGLAEMVALEEVGAGKKPVTRPIFISCYSDLTF